LIYLLISNRYPRLPENFSFEDIGEKGRAFRLSPFAFRL